MAVFHGEHRHTVDSKGRVAVPNAFRKRLSSASEGKLILLLGRDRTIEVHPLSEWDEFVGATLRQLPRYDERALRVRRNRFRSHEIEIDRQGRILLPKIYREKLEIGTEVVFAGVGDWFEIWESGSYDAYHDAADVGIMDDLAALERAGWRHDGPTGGTGVSPTGDGR